MKTRYSVLLVIFAVFALGGCEPPPGNSRESGRISGSRQAEQPTSRPTTVSQPLLAEPLVLDSPQPVLDGVEQIEPESTPVVPAPTEVPKPKNIRILTRSLVNRDFQVPTDRGQLPRIYRERFERLQSNPTAASYRILGDELIAKGWTLEGAAALAEEAKLYSAMGRHDAAELEHSRAIRSSSRLELVALTVRPHQVNWGRLEPQAGCYLGAFVDHVDGLDLYRGDNWQSHRVPVDFAKRIRRRHATYLTYASYGTFVDRGNNALPVFPRRWLSICKQQGVIPQLAWEPRDLTAIRNDDYLRSCAQFLRQLDWPVFIRFASEMNGNWTPYHGNPALYREKFRLVSSVIRASAPKVAMVWCPSATPTKGMDDYYPGDDVVDWVGLNVYSVAFLDNNAKRPAFDQSPLELVTPFYQRYARRKPMAICEYGSSHRNTIRGDNYSALASNKLRTLYEAIPRLFPRIKMVTYFCCNAMKHGNGSRRLNNYSLTESPELLAAYRAVTGPPYFFGSWKEARQRSAPSYRILRPGEVKISRRARSLKLSIWNDGPNPGALVVLQINGQPAFAERGNGGHDLEVELPEGDTPIKLEIRLFRKDGRQITSKEWNLARTL